MTTQTRSESGILRRILTGGLAAAVSICGFAGSTSMSGGRPHDLAPAADDVGRPHKGHGHAHEHRTQSRPVHAYARPITKSARISERWGVPGSWAAGHHTGIDFAAPEGTTVRSVGTGRVELAGEAGAYGNAVIVHMKDGKHVLFAHLSKISVRVGRAVRANTVIGASGNTGRTTGPHLHFEVRQHRGYGTEVDPVPYLARHGVRIA
ncbi:MULTISPECIES: M23 family metallopeptidase [Streptomyces]|uniref:M23 family metallopeptidase n=1 Tax=Streptomyces TaxID=1883 RepID=UPI001FD0936E|nr:MULTISPECIES: M23 family metallopeptidase [Streptomyces]